VCVCVLACVFAGVCCVSVCLRVCVCLCVRTCVSVGGCAERVVTKDDLVKYACSIPFSLSLSLLPFSSLLLSISLHLSLSLSLSRILSCAPALEFSLPLSLYLSLTCALSDSLPHARSPALPFPPSFLGGKNSVQRSRTRRSASNSKRNQKSAAVCSPATNAGCSSCTGNFL